MRETESKVQAFKSDYESKVQGLKSDEEKIRREKSKIYSAITYAEGAKRRQEELIESRAKEMYECKKNKLIWDYKERVCALYGAFFASLAYGFMITIFTAIYSKAFVADFKDFFSKIATLFILIWKGVSIVANFAAKLGDMIPQKIVAFLLHWLIVIAIFVIFFGILGALVVIGVKKFFEWYFKKLDFEDNFSQGEILIVFALTVFFADAIRAVLPINILLLNILIHAIYVVIRFYIKSNK